MKVNIGDKIYIPNEVKAYKVRACDDEYIIATKPFNIKHTVIYFIIDVKSKLRGADNSIFCMGYESDEDIIARFEELHNNEISLSRRNSVYCELTNVGNGEWVTT